MSALVLFLILVLSGLFIVFLGSRLHGPLRFFSFLAGICAIIIGLYGVLTYFL